MKQTAKVYPLLLDARQVTGVMESDVRKFGKPKVDIDKLRLELIDIKNGLVGIFEETDRKEKFGLYSLEVSLTIGAEGKIWFIASGSIEGSIKLTFKRPD